MKVETYKGKRAMDRGVRKMARKGWGIQSVSERKALFSLAGGIFTRKRIYTVAYVKAVAQAA